MNIINILDREFKYYIYCRGGGLPVLGIKIINGYNNTNIQDKIKKDKIIIDTVRYILII